MDDAIALLVQHGYLIVFVWVLAEQLGLPLPSTIVLLAAGALLDSGELQWWGLVIAGVLGAMLSDLFWFQLGRLKGLFILGTICRISLEPDSCVRRTQEMFARSAPRTLLIAKFIPGLSTAAPPLAGMFRMPLPRFLFFDLAGALLWVSSFILAGFLFRKQLEWLIKGIEQLGLGAGLLVALLISVWITWKWVQRKKFIRALQVATVTPEEVRNRLETGMPMLVVDLRHSLEFNANPRKIPGALRLDPEDLANGTLEVPQDRETVLYCTCPNAASSARIALMLKRRGVDRVRPLAGGFQGWISRGYPVEEESEADSRHQLQFNSARV